MIVLWHLELSAMRRSRGIVADEASPRVIFLQSFQSIFGPLQERNKLRAPLQATPAAALIVFYCIPSKQDVVSSSLTGRTTSLSFQRFVCEMTVCFFDRWIGTVGLNCVSAFFC